MNWLRPISAFIMLPVILGSIGYSIAQKEATLAEGRTILLEMAPVDPRSLIQGDFMRLRYHPDLFPDKVQVEKLPYKGHVILTLDEQSKASFARLDDNGPLAENEIKVIYRRSAATWRRAGMKYAANSYFFEEGQAERFANAKFVMLTVDLNGETVLSGLATENGERISEY